MSTPQKNLGVGRLLIAVYAVFAISSSARATYQLATKFEEAPLAYSLSALAGLVYIVATIALARPKFRRLALITIVFELAGVIAVGLLSFTLPELFAHPSVWSKFGQGYGYVPLVLPVLGLLWLRKTHKN
ncbi:hypothetical protein [Rhodoluna lacicola]|uniref:Integral membrane protein n=1 Tax=Rhodoluna lacicola TaxID=529884 RepID=A0A060JBM8_9MICO|nr:hypothetical protein [Rhodoluna lacicola]AIC47276.1 hypothetical protein Rhola_00004570 [Rhodoluna lacicola]